MLMGEIKIKSILDLKLAQKSLNFDKIVEFISVSGLTNCVLG